MIARLVLFLTAITLSLNTAFADILVQPGYGQPHAATHAPIYSQQPVHQVFRQNPVPLEHYDPELLAQLLYEQDLMHYLASLQPLHQDQAQAAGPTVGFPLLHHHHYLPLLPRLIPRRHLHAAKLGGLGFLGPSVLVGQPHAPLAVHHRSRRSTGVESDSGGAEDKNAVAAKPALNKRSQTAADSANRGDKRGERHEETHQGKTNHATPRATLLGLNPERMIPGYHQTHLANNIEQAGTEKIVGAESKLNNLNLDSDAVGQGNILMPLAENQESSGVKRQRSSGQSTSGEKVKSSKAGCSARAASHDTHESKGNKNQRNPLRVIMPDDGESVSSDDQDYVSMSRNFPDPRPVSSPSSTSNQKKVHHRDEYRRSGAHNSQRASWNERSGDNSEESDEIVGTSWRRHQKLHGLKHPHKHRTSSLPSYTYYDIRPYETCTSPCATSPAYYVYNTDYGARSGSTRMMEPGASRIGQYVQVPTVQSGNYASNGRYVVLPESYSNQAAVPISGYPWSSPYYIRRYDGASTPA